VQVDPMNSTLKAPRYKRLTLKCDEPLPNFAFKFSSRHFIEAFNRKPAIKALAGVAGRGLHSPTSQVNLSRF
jgi:hypothetical protein